MGAQELRNLQEAYMEVYNQLDEGRGDDLRTKYGLQPGEVSARLSKRAEREALNIGGRTHFDRQRRDPLSRLSGLSRTRSQGETPAGNSRRNSQGQLRDIRSRGGRPSNIYDAGADRDRGNKGERFADFVSGKRDSPNMTDDERRFAHNNRKVPIPVRSRSTPSTPTKPLPKSKAQSKPGSRGGGSSSLSGVGNASGTGGFTPGSGGRYGLAGTGLADHYDFYDIILSHLLDEGYAETSEAAEAIMVNMSEEWRDSILG